jgi:hypothetical protein
MKQFVKLIFSFLVALLSFVNLHAQDVIHRKNGKTIEAKVLEVGEAEVKYKLFTQPDGVTYVMDATLIKKIVMANGAVHKFEEGGSIDNTEYYVGQKKSAYKINFIGIVFGYTSLAYERSLKPGSSFEGRLTLIGLGKSNDSYYSSSTTKQALRGLGLTGGYKFIHKPDYSTSRQRYAHLLKGGYIRPEITLASYSQNQEVYSTSPPYNHSTQRVNTTYACFMLAFGKQWIFDNSFAVDFYTGVALGVKTKDKNNSNEGAFGGGRNYGGNSIADNGFSLSMGISVGFLGK